MPLAGVLYQSFTRAKAEFLSRGFLRGQEEYLLWGYGHTGRALCRALASYGKRPSHIVEVHPGRIGQRIQGAEVVSPEEISSLPSRPLLASVAGAGPRHQVRSALADSGFVEGRDYVCVA